MKQFVKKKVSFVMVMIMAVITVISMSLPMAVFAQKKYTLTLKNEIRPLFRYIRFFREI